MRRASRSKILAGALALSVTGCFEGVTDFAVITPDFPGVLYTVKKNFTDLLVHIWGSDNCNLDFNGNGIPGGPQDRAFCTLYHMRAYACNTLSGVEYNLCYAATDLQEEWEDLNEALDQVRGSDDCLAVHIDPTDGNTYNWTARRLGTGGCRAS